MTEDPSLLPQTSRGLDLDGAAVVVTGAGSGIGRELARRFAVLGARVVVNDVDASAAEQTAADIDGAAFVGDMTDPGTVERLVDYAWSRLGRIDLFCANVGEVVGGSEEVPDSAWQQAWQVNVMSHVYAARALLPRWRAAGGGRLLATISAAGMLTVPGMAPYVVSKHAAFSFAEWLHMTYAHENVVVQVLCPMGVRTSMLDRVSPLCAPMMQSSAIPVETVADATVEALRGDRFLILPHPEVGEWYTARAATTDEWLTGMNQLHQQLADALTQQV